MFYKTKELDDKFCWKEESGYDKMYYVSDSNCSCSYL